jgi:leader peptidase (prepilin peptidase) / N-methyltransferase
LWVIPLSICWFVTAVGVVGSGLGRVLIGSEVVDQYHLFPAASGQTGAIAAGAMIGMCISLLALKTGILKASYMSESEEDEEMTLEGNNNAEENVNHRLEMLKEIVFLLPIVVCAFAWQWVVKNTSLGEWWVDFTETPLINGILGSLWGYCVGCGLVWATRILGTLGFGKEAMGLGDVHLMGAAGAVVGPVFVLIAFFVAPFFGLLWVGCQIFFRKIRQIPYGPFLSLGVFAVMIFHDRIREYLMSLYLYQ